LELGGLGAVNRTKKTRQNLLTIRCRLSNSGLMTCWTRN